MPLPFLLLITLGQAALVERPTSVREAATVDIDVASRFAALALACVHREFPNKVAHVLSAPADAKVPSRLTPAFYGCYDWHSSVHGHWLLARLARAFPTARLAADAKRALGRSLTPKNLAAEVAYVEGQGRVSFERPYGLAWLLQLGTELREWDDADAKRWAAALAPLEAVAVKRLMAWLPKLSRPIRVGEHDQTAFAFGLLLDWARATGHRGLEALLVERAQAYYLADVACPLTYEPGGQDFLSPCLAEADLMRRLLPKARFASWLTAFLPTLSAPQGPWLTPEKVTDRADPKLAHLDGLNLSRAWMLEGVCAGLPDDDPRRVTLEAAARAHRDAGLEAVTGEHYEGGHWLGSFATYLVTGRGLR
ncbi:MAG: DUF2891 domain-containing protein [Myxococcaceae bacterium]|jgi:hypothetical protein|nr:DUF2891 domain-containing protein [Myxococcaceae bacterium]MCA3015438.1 DUF2891 domain-containing protein [Myxococcaceae bacterium]